MSVVEARADEGRVAQRLPQMTRNGLRPVFHIESIVMPAAGLDAKLAKVALERPVSFGLRRVGQRRTPNRDAAWRMSPAVCRVVLLPIWHIRKKIVPSRLPVRTSTRSACKMGVQLTLSWVGRGNRQAACGRAGGVRELRHLSQHLG